MDLDVVGLGYCCQDELLLLSEIPGPEGRATIRQREVQGGGMVATAMVAVARLGGRAGFVTKLGDDDTGKWIREDFQRYGVDVSRVVVQTGARSHRTVVLVDERTGSRSFLSDRGEVAEISSHELDREYVTQGAILHLSDASPAAMLAAHWAKEAGREVCFDGTHFHPSTMELIPLLDYLIVSRFFAAEYVSFVEGRDIGRAARDFAALTPVSTPQPPSVPPQAAALYPTARVAISAAHSPPQLAGEQLLAAAQHLRRFGPDVVVVTEGESGSWCASPQGNFHVPSYPAQVVDTTGAGDVFHGAFVYAQANRWDLERSLRLASATASLKCRALGGRGGIPTLGEALALMGEA
jgi:sulfofructose kinase